MAYSLTRSDIDVILHVLSVDGNLSHGSYAGAFSTPATCTKTVQMTVFANAGYMSQNRFVLKGRKGDRLFQNSATHTTQLDQHPGSSQGTMLIHTSICKETQKVAVHIVGNIFRKVCERLGSIPNNFNGIESQPSPNVTTME